MNYIIIDDEPIAHRIIEGYCEKFNYLEKKGNAYDAFEAMELMHEQSLDLIFLDINMPKMNGFELLRSLPKAPQVIVTSAYKEYAVEGFELNVVDYLLKPFSFSRFMTAINKLEKKVSSKDQFFVKSEKKLINIDIKDLQYVEGCGNYVKLVVKDKPVICYQKLSYYDEFLSQKGGFIRIHKSYIVNEKWIESIEGNTIVIQKHSIPIGQKYKKQLLDQLYL
ncbi:DNA-binding response regulator [Flammeovirga sp. SubArs3]|uniref:LytR/AlgR family response regulator transcription factor n=1 Tax=Flammeovirga sp. SubArs3 TaxID=2995316 RepID=UPI00248C6B9B|nr:DNA-binding response regulator [Flammeovirga sp. SubArs3]